MRSRTESEKRGKESSADWFKMSVKSCIRSQQTLFGSRETGVRLQVRTCSHRHVLQSVRLCSGPGHRLYLDGGNRLQRRLFLSPQAGKPQTSWKRSGGGGGVPGERAAPGPRRAGTHELTRKMQHVERACFQMGRSRPLTYCVC